MQIKQIVNSLIEKLLKSSKIKQSNNVFLYQQKCNENQFEKIPVPVIQPLYGHALCTATHRKISQWQY